MANDFKANLLDTTLKLTGASANAIIDKTSKLAANTASKITDSLLGLDIEKKSPGVVISNGAPMGMTLE